MYKLFMKFNIPTKEFNGKKCSIQGFAIDKNIGFILFHTGICAAYDLSKKDADPIDTFKLGSYNDSPCDPRYINHANDAMFGNTLPGKEFPLMYVTAGNSGEYDENGYISYCAVEQLYRENNKFRSETVQKIYFKNDGIEQTNFCPPGWGWPSSLVDTDGGWYYLLSARYRTKKEFSKPDNVYIITKFKLPDPSTEKVTLYPKDIVDQYFLPFNVYATQGGTIKNNKIYYTFGFGTPEYPDALRIIDLKNKCFEVCEDLSNAEFANEELECCAFFENRLLINTQHGNIFERL